MDSEIILFIYILVGFVLLYFGAEKLVEGAEKISFNLNIPKAIVGVVVVAFGTSAPEFFVNLICAFRDETNFALANIAGSNLTNICFGLGLMGVIVPCVIPYKKFKIDFLFLVLGPIILLVSFYLSNSQYLHFNTGIVLALLLFVFLSISFRRFHEDKTDNVKDNKDLIIGIFWFIFGIGLLWGGGELVVHGCLEIGEKFEVNPEILGLTVVAMGTSIPDVMASIVAARKSEFEIAFGNIIGSNIFNIFTVLGSTILISRKNLGSSPEISMDYIMVLIVSVCLVAIAFSFKKMNRFTGLFFIALFVGYYIMRIM